MCAWGIRGWGGVGGTVMLWGGERGRTVMCVCGGGGWGLSRLLYFGEEMGDQS